jgi:hypothetical protein
MVINMKQTETTDENERNQRRRANGQNLWRQIRTPRVARCATEKNVKRVMMPDKSQATNKDEQTGSTKNVQYHLAVDPIAALVVVVE